MTARRRPARRAGDRSQTYADRIAAGVTRPVTIGLDGATLDALDALAERHGTSRSGVVRLLVERATDPERGDP